MNKINYEEQSELRLEKRIFQYNNFYLIFKDLFFSFLRTLFTFSFLFLVPFLLSSIAVYKLFEYYRESGSTSLDLIIKNVLNSITDILFLGNKKMSYGTLIFSLLLIFFWKFLNRFVDLRLKRINDQLRILNLDLKESNYKNDFLEYFILETKVDLIKTKKYKDSFKWWFLILIIIKVVTILLVNKSKKKDRDERRSVVSYSAYNNNSYRHDYYSNYSNNYWPFYWPSYYGGTSCYNGGNGLYSRSYRNSDLFDLRNDDFEDNETLEELQGEIVKIKRKISEFDDLYETNGDLKNKEN